MSMPPKIEPVICFSLIYVLRVNKLYKGKYQTEQSIKEQTDSCPLKAFQAQVGECLIHLLQAGFWPFH